MTFQPFLDEIKWFVDNFYALQKGIAEYRYDGLRGKDYTRSGKPSDDSSVETAVLTGQAIEPRYLIIAEQRAQRTIEGLRVIRKGLAPFVPLAMELAQQLAEDGGDLCFNPNCSYKASGQEGDRLMENRDNHARCSPCYHYWYRKASERPLELCLKDAR